MFPAYRGVKHVPCHVKEITNRKTNAKPTAYGIIAFISLYCMNSRLFIYLPVWSFAGITACLIAFGIWQTRKIDERLASKTLPTSFAPIFCTLDYGPGTLVLLEKNGKISYVYPGPGPNPDVHPVYRDKPDSTVKQYTDSCWPIRIYADRDIPGTEVLKITDSLRSNCKYRCIRLLVKYYPGSYIDNITTNDSTPAGG